MCVFGKVSLSVLLLVLGEYWICVFSRVSLSVFGWYSVSIARVYLVRFR